jgi:NAD(P)-dependent dehydrogenase (short-subunit alcohol dehydrogenase family)
MGRSVASWLAPAKWRPQGLTAALQVEWPRDGITARLLSPGATDTSFWRQNAPGLISEQLGRFIRPGTITDAVVWVLSTTGRVLVSDLSIRAYRNPFEDKGSPFGWEG